MVAHIFIVGQILNRKHGCIRLFAVVVVVVVAELTVNGHPFNGKPLTPWFSPVENRKHLKNDEQKK